MITIVDYGMGNLGSIQNMLKRIGVPSMISNQATDLAKAEKLILPGVGAFDKAMAKLRKGDLINILEDRILGQKVPLLGICLGMQLLTDASEEGEAEGLGWIPGRALRFKQNSDLKVPHMGWNRVSFVGARRLTKGFDRECRFYFVHSYFVKTKHIEHKILQAEYGVTFDAAIGRENIYGAQFHPEKSHHYGMKLLENFSNL